MADMESWDLILLVVVAYLAVHMPEDRCRNAFTSKPSAAR